MAERYTRQEQLTEYADFAVKAAAHTVGIIGAGGLGGLCTYLLAAAGVKRLKLADGDDIELSNLHRQVLYRLEDVNKSKVQCAKAALLALDPDLQLETFGRITAENFAAFAQGCTLILDLSDNLQTRLLVNQECLRLRLDYIHAAVAAEQALLCAFAFSSEEFIRKFGCYACMSGEDAQAKPQGITGPYAAALSSLCADLAMQCLNGSYKEYGTMLHFDFKKFSVQKFKLQRARHCSFCQRLF